MPDSIGFGEVKPFRKSLQRSRLIDAKLAGGRTYHFRERVDVRLDTFARSGDTYGRNHFSLAIAAITPMMEIQIDELDAPVLSLLVLKERVGRLRLIVVRAASAARARRLVRRPGSSAFEPAALPPRGQPALGPSR
jgi:hypothetical protein